MKELRKLQEKREFEYLSVYAIKSAQTKGRKHPMQPCPVRTEFQRDRDRILHSKSFRHLKDKAQVFIAPQGDDYRTRLTHTLEVVQIARTIARAMRLNEDLTEAIALGHDLGHTPFGHAGEKALNAVVPGGFDHSAQSLRIVDALENGTGLNLTYEVRDGIRNHGLNSHPCCLEGCVVRLADKIAYINHDVDDAARAGVLDYDSMQPQIRALVSMKQGERIDVMVQDALDFSYTRPFVRMTQEMFGRMMGLREYLFENVYTHPLVLDQERKAEKVVLRLYEYYHDDASRLPQAFQEQMRENSLETVICDYIVGMSDRTALRMYQELFLPRAWA